MKAAVIGITLTVIIGVFLVLGFNQSAQAADWYVMPNFGTEEEVAACAKGHAKAQLVAVYDANSLVYTEARCYPNGGVN